MMQKLPNAWGLYDVMGNVYEVTYSVRLMVDFPGPMVDPWRVPKGSDPVTAKGGSANVWPDMLRAAQRFPLDPTGLGFGLRLVRTLKDGETWPPASK